MKMNDLYEGNQRMLKNKKLTFIKLLAVITMVVIVLIIVIPVVKNITGYSSKKTQNVTVIDENPPVVTLNGNNEISIDVGSEYIELGATAIDDVDGNLTGNIVTTGTVTVNTVGTYTITYKVIDNSGNVGEEVRTVHVIDNNSVVITNVMSEVNNITDTSFTIVRNESSTDNHDEIATNIYQTSINGSTWGTVCTNNTTSCNVEGLNSDTIYQYRICVKDVYGNHNCTSSKTIKTLVGVFDVSKGINRPQLVTGMTPIKWNGTAEVITTADDHDWYNYSEKKWANAKTEDGSYWVWIPRYAYKITSGWHTGGKDVSGTIDIKFLIGKTNETSDGTTIRTSGYSVIEINTSNAYFKHPAFTFNGEELGFWVAKFEPSVSNLKDMCYTNASAVNCNKTTLVPKIVPDVSSWRYITIGNAFEVALNMKNNLVYGWSEKEVDTHMMKNVEWGAVVYLSQSIYGANEVIWVNPTSDNTTGCGGVRPIVPVTAGCQNRYNTINGQKTSTTHNITGVYDTSGGAYDVVSAYVDYGHEKSTSKGQNIIAAPSKYKDVYRVVSLTSTPISNYNNNKNKYGDAIYETSVNGFTSTGTSWYANHSSMPFFAAPWFHRGGYYAYRVSSVLNGVFSFDNFTGDSSKNMTFRPVVTPIK